MHCNVATTFVAFFVGEDAHCLEVKIEIILNVSNVFTYAYKHGHGLEMIFESLFHATVLGECLVSRPSWRQLLLRVGHWEYTLFYISVLGHECWSALNASG